MSKEVLSKIKSSLDSMLSELNSLKANICVTLVYVEHELAKVRDE